MPIAKDRMIINKMIISLFLMLLTVSAYVGYVLADLIVAAGKPRCSGLPDNIVPFASLRVVSLIIS